MSPMRILIIAILIYIGFLLFKSTRNKNRAKRIDPDHNSRHSTSDVLVEDPICGTLVPKGQAVRLETSDSIEYFCSDDCCKKFMKEKNLKS